MELTNKLTTNGIGMPSCDLMSEATSYLLGIPIGDPLGSLSGDYFSYQ